ncbi:MAG: class I mannose-6-phosphate isomerase [Hespellia sp.]|nr:class I mannose-6-phosphate isomerase [Hespellia sp.]
MKRYHNYEKRPKVKVKGFDQEVWDVTQDICSILKEKLDSKKKTQVVLTVECYPGVRKEEIKELLSGLEAELWLDADALAYEGRDLDERMQRELTDDRVFGIYTTHGLKDYFIEEKVEEAVRQISKTSGLTVVCGTGASLICEGDVLLYCDMARWEIQKRYRAGMSNWNTENSDAPILSKYKRGFFIEWRLADQRKKQLLDQIDFLLDTNTSGHPHLLSGDAFREGLRQAAQQPFRVVPYFDPGVWGGQWMKEVCGLNPEEENYAWSFDGVPEENSLLLDFGGREVEIPAIDLVFYRPHELLGEHVHARFGTEFPIRFDLLDTMGGQNLSLQVHPLTEYIQDKFNMRYTQDESYYILDAEEKDTYVYLGLKEGIDPAAMGRDLKAAQDGSIRFPAEEYVNKIPVKKHDHVLIPAGTVHCSGAGTMVLEISATPYIFTFKLWDWDRLGLDGLPRPTHIEHGLANIQWDRDTEWVKEHLIDQVEVLAEEEGLRMEKTGLHDREFIETTRVWMEKEVRMETKDSVNVLNLVEGKSITVESTDGAFAPYEVHYAETFIIPAAVKEFILRPKTGEAAAVICANVR